MAQLRRTALEKDRALWDHYQQDGPDDAFRAARYRLDLVARTLRRLKPKGRVLDIGLGSGYLVSTLARLGYDAFGCDLSTVNVARLARRLSGRVPLVAGNVNALPLGTATFDAVVASEVIEHLSDADLTAGLADIRRCLRPDGVAVITVPADEVLRDLECFCPNCGEVFHRYGHRQSFARERLSGVLAQHGFRRVTVERFVEIAPEAHVIERVKHLVKRTLLAVAPRRWPRQVPSRYMATAWR